VTTTTTTTAATTTPRPASSPSAIPTGQRQQQQRHQPSRPHRAPIVEAESARLLDPPPQQQHQQQHQRPSLAAELLRGTAAPAGQGSADQQQQQQHGAIVAPLRVRRRGPRPQTSYPPPAPQRAAAAGVAPVITAAAAAAAATATATAARSPRQQRRHEQQQPQQEQQQQEQEQQQQARPHTATRFTPRSRAALLAGLAVAVGAIAALASTAYAPPPAFAASSPSTFAGGPALGSGGGAGGLAAAAAAATIAPQWLRAVSAGAAAAASPARRRAASTAAAAAAATTSPPPPRPLSASDGPPVRLLAVVGAGGARSPYEYAAPTAASLAAGQGPAPPPPPPWRDVAPHLAERLALSNPRFRLEVLREEELLAALDRGGRGAAEQAGATAAANEVLARAVKGTPAASAAGSTGAGAPPSPAPPLVAIVAMGLTDARTADLIASPSGPAAAVGTLLALPTDAEKHGGSSTSSSSGNGVFARLEAAGERVGGFDPARAGSVARWLAEHVPFSPQARAAKLLREAREMLSRRTSDDAVFAMLTIIHGYGGVSVPDVANAAQGGLDLALLTCIAQHCREPVAACVTDPTCKAGLDCLAAVPPNDQVASYRCIVAHENPYFARFSLCVLQLHNCRGLSAEMPAAPDPPPMPSFRGAPLTHAVAEGILYGHGIPSGGPTAAPPTAAAAAAQLVPGTRKWAWRIAGGKNAAFDRFPAQHQLFYRTGSAPPGSAGGAIWYVPVFAVSPDGGVLKEKVWRDRRYRVRLGQTPGGFLFTVSDNGVTSIERWTLLDAEDGLDWSLFYYRGAASAAGMSYSGAVLATRDGEWPGGAESARRIESALAAAGIEPWELTRVDNSEAAVQGAPLPPNGGWPTMAAAAA